jgi:hypothetical protein
LDRIDSEGRFRVKIEVRKVEPVKATASGTV